MVDPNKKPGTKSLNVQAWERLLDHPVGDLRVAWVPKVQKQAKQQKKSQKYQGPPIQACWMSGFIPDTFHEQAGLRCEPDLEMRDANGEVVATAKLQPKAANAAKVIPEPPLLRHRGAMKPLPVARAWVWATALNVVPQDCQWSLRYLSTDEEFVLNYFRSHRDDEVIFPGDLLDSHLRWEEEVAERERRRIAQEEARAAAEKAAAEKAAAEKAAAVDRAVVLLADKGVTDHTVIPDSIREWELQEKARVILDAGDNDPDSVLAAAALFQD